MPIPKQNKNQRGFTLLELLIVIAIIGILSTSAVVNISIAKAKARDVKRLQELNQFSKGLDLYYNYYEAYPCGDNSDDDTYNENINGERGTKDNSRNGGGCIAPHGNEDRAGFLNAFGAADPAEIIFECDDTNNKPTGGLFSEGLLNSSCPKDPINTSGPINTNALLYWYHASYDRELYLLVTRLETGNEIMVNDGGLCTDLYERGTGLGILRPDVEFCGDPY